MHFQWRKKEIYLLFSNYVLFIALFKNSAQLNPTKQALTLEFNGFFALRTSLTLCLNEFDNPNVKMKILCTYVYIIIYVCILVQINNICTEIEAMLISYGVPYIVYRKRRYQI